MDAILGLLFAMSSGLGFDPGLGVELGLQSPKFEIIAHTTSEHKMGEDYGYTYGLNGSAFLQIAGGPVALGAGFSHYGYVAEYWNKTATAPMLTLAYRPDSGDYRVFYIAEDDVTSAVVGVSVDTEISDSLSLAMNACKTLDYDGTTFDVGLRWRF